MQRHLDDPAKPRHVGKFAGNRRQVFRLWLLSGLPRLCVQHRSSRHPHLFCRPYRHLGTQLHPRSRRPSEHPHRRHHRIRPLPIRRPQPQCAPPQARLGFRRPVARFGRNQHRRSGGARRTRHRPLYGLGGHGLGRRHQRNDAARIRRRSAIVCAGIAASPNQPLFRPGA